MSNQTGLPIPALPASSSQDSETWRHRFSIISNAKRRINRAVVALAYRLYSRQLMADVLSRPMPKHVAMIIDGNRRFAIRSHLPHVAEGHKLGAQKVSEVVNWCDDLGIPVVTIWGLSTDNLSRDPDELNRLFEIVTERLNILSQGNQKNPHKRRVCTVGRLELLPENLRSTIKETERKTADWGPNLLNIAVAYGGRDEIVDAFRRMLRAKAASGVGIEEIADNFTSKDLQAHLYSPDVPEPDLIIRTSGEIRLSGFLLWQSVYSELYFCDVPWPAFRKIDFLRAIRSFQTRQRRYGH